MKVGTKVKSLVLIQSDDRANGIEDGSPIIPVGTPGEVLGKSEEFLPDEVTMKGDEQCYTVRFSWEDQSANYDILPEEIEVIEE